jgi:polysaccharide biosynthesis protein PslH
MNKPPSASAKKAKALFLSPEAPYPAIGGGPLRSASLLEYLASQFSVHAIVFRQPGDPGPALAVPAGRIAKLDVLDLPFHSKHPVARSLRNARRLFRNTPPLVDRFAGFESAIAALLSGNRYECAIIEHSWCAAYLEQLRPHAKRVVLDLHNLESLWHQSMAAHESPLRAWALRRFATASVALERKWWPRFDSILTTSTADAAFVRKIARDVPIAIFPNALPEVPGPVRCERQEIVFSGNIEYAPNAQAIRFFQRDIWPSLRARWPDLRWKIVGKNPDAVSALVRGDPRIEMTGFVEDAVTTLSQAQVAVVPLLSGSGTRIKILEAWAAGTAVVSTTLGAAGLEGCDGEHLLLADRPDHFADAVSRLLASPPERARIGAAGRRLYEQSYTWPAAWRSLDSVFGNEPVPEKV